MLEKMKEMVADQLNVLQRLPSKMIWELIPWICSSW